MADNYIERQQEQYEARKAAWKQAQKYGKKKTTTSSQVKTEVAGEIVSKPDSLKKKSIRDRRSGRHRESNSRSIL